MFIVYCYNEDINDISVTLSVQGQFFFCCLVLSFCGFDWRPLSDEMLCWCLWFWNCPSRPVVLWRVWIGEPPLSRFLKFPVEERQVFAMIWTANGRRRITFFIFRVFFLDGKPFQRLIKDNYFFPMNFWRTLFTLNILILYNWKNLCFIGMCIVYLGFWNFYLSLPKTLDIKWEYLTLI